MHSTRRFVLVLLFPLAFFCLVYPQSAQRPSLIVFISIDQMRADYLPRFSSQFTGGFKRLYSEGVVYDNADLNYSGSETGPGHTTLSTGCYPSRSGILANEWFDRDAHKQVYCVDDANAKPVEGEGGGASPKNLVVTGIGDWLKRAYPSSKVVTASSKDRAAILMGAKHPDYAFWYDRKTGHMVTSSYYTQKLPDWVKAFNAQNWVDKSLPAEWTKLMPDSVYAPDGPDEMEGETPWGGNSSFPHSFVQDKKKDQVTTSPWGDALTLDFAAEAVRAEKLGQRGVIDLLCVALSCTDYIGHSFGPNSHEIHDHLLRLDLSLGAFFLGLEAIVGKGRVLYVLSADHGVMPLPEYLTQVKQESARRIMLDKEIKPRIDELDKSLQREFGVSESLILPYGSLNYAALRKAKLSEEEFESRVRSGLLKIVGITDVYFRRELVNKKTPNRPYLGHFQRSYYAPRGDDFLLLFCEYCLVTTRPTGTSHGTPYGYDTRIPIVFLSSGTGAAHVNRNVHSVDIAPTLAKMLGLRYPDSVDGSPLKELVR